MAKGRVRCSISVCDALWNHSTVLVLSLESSALRYFILNSSYDLECYLSSSVVAQRMPWPRELRLRRPSRASTQAEMDKQRTANS